MIAAWGDTVLRPRNATGGPSTSTTVVPPRITAVRIGERIERLDVPVIVGRRPTAPRLVSGPAPRLVVVSSPAQEVSSSHVEIRQDGDVVVVTDLRSTNGTVVRLPGRHPVKLRQGESTVALPGAIVDLGDGNTLEILAPPRTTVQEEPHT